MKIKNVTDNLAAVLKTIQEWITWYMIYSANYNDLNSSTSEYFH